MRGEEKQEQGTPPAKTGSTSTATLFQPGQLPVPLHHAIDIYTESMLSLLEPKKEK